MRARQWLPRFLRRGAREACRAARVLAPAGRRLAERLAYRPREVVIVALLAGGLFAGLAVERWRARHPATAERLEAEPPRLATAGAAPPTPRPRPRSSAMRCEAPGGGTTRAGRQPADSGLARPRFDLNRATPGELARLAGISWGLAARIVAAREAVEGAGPGTLLEPSRRERFTWSQRRLPAAPAGPAEPDTASPSGAPEPESIEDASGAAPR